MALLEPGRSMSTPHMMPSGERNFRIADLANQGFRELLASGKSGVFLVPVLDLGLAELPAEEHAPTAHHAREIDEALASILEQNPELLELALIPVDLLGNRLREP